MNGHLDRPESHPRPTIAPEVRTGIGTTAIRNLVPDSRTYTLESLHPVERAVFESGLAQTTKLYERTGITPPSLETFERSGVDFKHLADVRRLMQQADLEPVAIFSKADLGPEEARALYAHLRADETIPNNPLKNHVIPFTRLVRREDDERIPGAYVNDGLAINDGVIQNWQKVTQEVQSSEATDGWTLRLVSRAEQAPTSGPQAYSDTSITIPEYLTLQARLIQAGKPPVDNGNFIWLHSSDTFAPYYIEHPRAPIGGWDPKEGYVFIGHNRVEDGASKTINGIRPAWS